MYATEAALMMSKIAGLKGWNSSAPPQSITSCFPKAIISKPYPIAWQDVEHAEEGAGSGR